jgi:hypothetical protein
MMSASSLEAHEDSEVAPELDSPGRHSHTQLSGNMEQLLGAFDEEQLDAALSRQQQRHRLRVRGGISSARDHSAREESSDHENDRDRNYSQEYNNSNNNVEHHTPEFFDNEQRRRQQPLRLHPERSQHSDRHRQSPQMTATATNTEAPSTPLPDPAPEVATVEPPTVVDPRAALEYQIAWELELWRRTEQNRFLAHLNQVEFNVRRDLEKKYRAKHAESEHKMRAKEQNLEAVEKQVKEMMFTVEKEQQRLQVKDEMLTKRARLLDREYEQKKHDVVLSIRRLKAQFKHEKELTDKTLDENHDRIKSLRKKATSWESRFKRLQTEYFEFRTKADKSLNGQLRMALADKDREMQQLHEKLEKERASNDDLRMQLVRAEQEVSRVTSAQRQEELRQLEHNKAELARARLNMVATEQSRALARDRVELQSIRSKLDRVLTDHAMDSENHPIGASTTAHSAAADAGRLMSHITDDMSPEVQRLARERDTLLRSQLYSADHPLITKLTEKIYELQLAK